MSITVIQAYNSLNSGGAVTTSVGVPFAAPPSSGNAVVVPVSVRNLGSGAAVSSVTDNFGNTYVKVLSKASAGASPDSSEIWWCQSIGSTTSFTLTGVQITGIAGQCSCSASSTTITVGAIVKITGTFGGTGSITGYSNPTSYLVGATNGSTTFTLNLLSGSALTTTAGTPTGLTYTVPLAAIVTATASVCIAAGVIEVAGGITASDVTASVNDGGTQVLTATVTAGGADVGNDLVVAVISLETNSTGTALTDPAGNPSGGVYTSVYVTQGAFPYIGGCESSYRVNTASQTNAAQWSWTTTADNYSAVIASFKVASGAINQGQSLTTCTFQAMRIR